MAAKASERLSTADIAKYEATRYSGNQRLVDRIEQKLVRELLTRAAGGRKDLAVCDVPCGYGRFSAACLEIAGSLVDLDRSANMATRAKESGGLVSRAPITAGVVDIRALPIADKSFDVVLSMRLLHHLFEKADRAAMFRELHRITREHVVISYYDTTVIHRAQRKVAGIFKKKRREKKIFFFGTLPFLDEAKAAGFEVIDVRAPLRLFHAQRIALLRRR